MFQDIFYTEIYFGISQSAPPKNHKDLCSVTL